MSFAISIYDIFAFTVPGLLYLFVINEGLRILNYSKIDLSQLNLVAQWVVIVLLAYIVGQIFDFISLRLWVKLWYRLPDEERAYYKEFRDSRPDNETNFNPKQWSTLFALIQREDHITAERIDRNIAIRGLLRNVSFGLLIYSLLQFYLSFQAAFSLANFLLAICFLVLSFISLQKSEYYNTLLYTNIFQHAALYGKNLEEVMQSIRDTTPKKSQARRGKA
jgi:hypothetical protein